MTIKRKKKTRANSGPGGTRAQKTVQGILEGKSMRQAARDAGYSEKHIHANLYQSSTAKWIREQVERRQRNAMEKAAVHTDVIAGSLVEIMLASPADVLPENEILKRARENGVDHLIKKISITPMKLGMKERIVRGKKVSEPIIGQKVDLEMYSRLDAISQLRDNFGMKQEPRANTFEATRASEVEKEIDKIAEAEGCTRAEAAKMLRDALGNDSPLIPTVNKYVN